MLLDCTPVESFRLGWTSVTVLKKSIPRTAHRSCTVLTNSKTFCNLSLCQTKQCKKTVDALLSKWNQMEFSNLWLDNIILDVKTKITFSFWSSWSSDWYSSNFFRVRSDSSTAGTSLRFKLPVISPHIFWICDCTSEKSFILSSFCCHSCSSAGAIAASCSLIVPEVLSGCERIKEISS